MRLDSSARSKVRFMLACRQIAHGCPVLPYHKYDDGVQVETLEQIAKRLGWSPQRLAEAQASLAEPRPSNITDRDRARAWALSESLRKTREALDEAS